MAQLDQDIFEEVCRKYFYKPTPPAHVYVANNQPQKWDESQVKGREKFGLVSRRHYKLMISLLSEFSSINFFIKENPESRRRLAQASFQKLPPFKKVFKKLRTIYIEDCIADGCVGKDDGGEILISVKFMQFFTKILPNKKWFVDIPFLKPEDGEVFKAIEGLGNIYYISMNNSITPIFNDRLKAIFKKNSHTLKHFDGISGMDYSKIIPEEASFETCYIQCKPKDASDKPMLPHIKTKTFLLEGTTLTGFLFQQTTAEKFVIESVGFKRFFDKFASYLSFQAQSMEMASAFPNNHLKSIVVNIDFWSRDDVPYFGMFLKELMTYFPKLEKLTVRLNFAARVYGSNWHFTIIGTSSGLSTFENYFSDFKKLVELYWFEMTKFEHISFRVDFEAKFHYESIYEKFSIPDLNAMQRVFSDFNVQPANPLSIQLILDKYPSRIKSSTFISRCIASKNFLFNVRIHIISLTPSIGWKIVENGIKDIFVDDQEARKRYMDLYKLCYDFLTNSHVLDKRTTNSCDAHYVIGQELYENVKRFLNEKMDKMFEVCQNLDGDNLLDTYAEFCKNFENGLSILNGIFSYLNRHWIKRAIEDRHENVHEVAHLAKIIWKQNLFDRIRDNLESAILNQAKIPEISNFGTIYQQIDLIFGSDSISFDQITIKAAIGFVMKSLEHSNLNAVFEAVAQLLSSKISNQNLTNLFNFCLRSLVAKNYLLQAEDEGIIMVSLA